MSGNKNPFISDPEAIAGSYVGAGNFETVVKNQYDIRAFVKYMRETGREWNDLSDIEKSKFRLKES